MYYTVRKSLGNDVLLVLVGVARVACLREWCGVHACVGSVLAWV